MRRTKIIATVGPSTDKPGMLEKLLLAGVDLFRVNYSHQNHEDHERRVEEIRQASASLNIEVGIICDLQGPKIRIEKFTGGKIILGEGDNFTINTKMKQDAGDQNQVGVTYKKLARDVKKGDSLLVDDGKLVLEVLGVTDHEVKCKVVTGGELSNSKGINLQGGGLSAAALTKKDQEDLKHGVKIGADYFAVSFARMAEDILEARRLLDIEGSSASIIAKFERAEALENAESIIEVSDAVMIARGDLGVEIGDAALPPVQKRLIKLARDMDRAVITATQMMESMIDHQIPLRAEVFDVANAVLDGTDAVMLSGETSIGMFPDKVVESMSRICEETEKQRVTMVSDHRLNQRFERIDEAIAMSTMYAANHIGARAIAALTETGSTCLWMSRISSGIPVFAFTRHISTLRKVKLFRGVYPLQFDVTHTNPLEVNREIVDDLLEQKVVKKGDYVLITKGDLQGSRGGTNNMKILQVGSSGEDFI
ncbi:MAG: pyruvate kinase [Gammaproteobacteria bacterium]|nr:pyruvate kinase [Gammaproteobacteria bacterium]